MSQLCSALAGIAILLVMFGFDWIGSMVERNVEGRTDAFGHSRQGHLGRCNSTRVVDGKRRIVLLVEEITATQKLFRGCVKGGWQLCGRKPALGTTRCRGELAGLAAVRRERP